MFQKQQHIFQANKTFLTTDDPTFKIFFLKLFYDFVCGFYYLLLHKSLVFNLFGIQKPRE